MYPLPLDPTLRALVGIDARSTGGAVLTIAARDQAVDENEVLWLSSSGFIDGPPESPAPLVLGAADLLDGSTIDRQDRVYLFGRRDGHPVVLRVSAEGTLDPSFAGDGEVVLAGLPSTHVVGMVLAYDLGGLFLLGETGGQLFIAKLGS